MSQWYKDSNLVGNDYFQDPSKYFVTEESFETPSAKVADGKITCILKEATGVTIDNDVKEKIQARLDEILASLYPNPKAKSSDDEGDEAKITETAKVALKRICFSDGLYHYAQVGIQSGKKNAISKVVTMYKQADKAEDNEKTYHNSFVHNTDEDIKMNDDLVPPTTDGKTDHIEIPASTDEKGEGNYEGTRTGEAKDKDETTGG